MNKLTLLLVILFVSSYNLLSENDKSKIKITNSIDQLSYLTVDPNDTLITYQVGSFVACVFSNENWTVSESSPWITIGSGSGSIWNWDFKKVS